MRLVVSRNFRYNPYNAFFIAFFLLAIGSAGHFLLKMPIRKTCFLLFAALGLLLFSQGNLGAQNTQPPKLSVDLDGLSDLYGGTGGFSVGADTVYVTFQATLAKAPANDPKGADAYVVLNAKIQPSWHLYSITQPPGGPLKGKITLNPSGDYQQLGPFLTASDLHVEISDVFGGLRVESHLDQATWVAPLKLAAGKTLDGLAVAGKFDGQVCGGEHGLCVQVQNEPFEAMLDANLDVGLLLEKANRLAKTEPTASTGGAATSGYKPVETVNINDLKTALLYAFLGGLILNIMPCVLPVIGLKILSFFEQAGQSRLRAFALNVWYSLGLISVFVVLALLSVGLSRMFTYDLFNIIMICIVFAMSLSLMDVWELRMPSFLGSGKSAELMDREGAIGAFFKGIITTLLAIPCGAPLLSPALSWADEQIRAGAGTNVLIGYVFIGLGMASPYLLIGAFPELLRFLPKPGMWMLTFKKIMGFFLLLAVVWILYFISLDCIVPVVGLMFALWFACWLIGRLPLTAPASERGKAWFFGLLCFGLVLVFSFDIPGIANPYTLQSAMRSRLNDWAGVGEDHYWKPFTEEALNAALTEGRPVLVDFTADWCMSCKYFEATVLKTEEIQSLLDRKKIVSLKADCTKSELEGAVFLAKLGSPSVPVLALFTPEKPTEPTVIRGGFYKKTVTDLLEPLPE